MLPIHPTEPELEDSNRSANPSVHAVSDPARRQWLQGGLGLGLGGLLAPLAAGSVVGLGACAGPAGGAAHAGALASTRAGKSATPAGQGPRLGFAAVPTGTADMVVVPPGYVAQTFAAWGEPVGLAKLPAGQPAWKPDASNSAADQAQQFGMHHDGMCFYALPPQANGRQRGLLAMNHEYGDDQLLHSDGGASWTADKAAKSQAAHGISVAEVALDAKGQWQLVRPSAFARRFTAHTPFAVGGPAAGHALMRTAADPHGRTVLGTINNCAAGATPWGTYLSGEENWAGYFDGADKPDADQRRFGMRKTGWARWSGFDARFDARQHPNEFHRFGWVVEVDPMDPVSTPVKRTALGRAAHEGAWVAVTADGRAVVYTGEDAAFEYIYKFVSRDRIAPASAGLTQAQANRHLLDHGTLYVARFDADGTGRWLPLVFGQGPLTAANGFADQGEVVIKTRQASDLLGATKMDRPEWLAIDQHRREVYCTLTNNSARGAPGKPGVDGANPRANNVMGQIIRWRETPDFDATTLRWNHLMLAGDPANARPEAKGNIQGDHFANPDGVTFGPNGLLWIQTDMSTSQAGKGEFTRMGNNNLLACNTVTGEVRRFLVGPRECEITGVTFAPDGCSLFLNIQHPGEAPGGRNDPAQPERHSSWPGGPGSGRPRSATVVVRRLDGGEVGS